MKTSKPRQLRGYLGFSGAQRAMEQLAPERENILCQKAFQAFAPEHVARQCSILLFQNRELCVFSARPEWTSWLRNRQKRLTEHLQSACPLVKTVRIVTAPRGLGGYSKPVAEKRTAPTGAGDIVGRSAQHIKNPELKEAMARLARRLEEKSATDADPSDATSEGKE